MKTIRILRHPSQRGHGLGSLFKSIFKTFIPVAKTIFCGSKPLLKNVAKSSVRTLGKEGLQIAADTVSDVMHNETDLKTAMVKNVKAGGKRVLKKGSDALSKRIKAGAKTNFDSVSDQASLLDVKPKKKKSRKKNHT